MQLSEVSNRPQSPLPFGDRVGAGLGLLGYLVIWLVAIVPCTLWLAVSVVANAARQVRLLNQKSGSLRTRA
jgi:hypothetical protein